VLSLQASALHISRSLNPSKATHSNKHKQSPLMQLEMNSILSLKTQYS